MNGSNKTKSRSRSRFRWSWVFFILLVGCILWAAKMQNQNMGHSSFTTGYVLLGCIVFLTLFNLRKKLPFIPGIGTARFWMRLHIYVGLSTFAIFAFHIGWKVPSGKFETLLAFLYMFVACSGVYGLYATRMFPVRLTGLSEEVIFERIPWRRHQLADQARSLVLNSSHSTDVLARLYANKLANFFERPPSLSYLLRPNRKERRRLVAEIENANRYLGPAERSTSRELSLMIQKRDDLDYHLAIQGRLKVWLFLHIGMTYSLLACGCLHAVLAHVFHGGF